jgi:hypothetical protein
LIKFIRLPLQIALNGEMRGLFLRRIGNKNKQNTLLKGFWWICTLESYNRVLKGETMSKSRDKGEIITIDGMTEYRVPAPVKYFFQQQVELIESMQIELKRASGALDAAYDKGVEDGKRNFVEVGK